MLVIDNFISTTYHSEANTDCNRTKEQSVAQARQEEASFYPVSIPSATAIIVETLHCKIWRTTPMEGAKREW